MTNKKPSRSRAAASGGRVTPKGVRPAGYTTRVASERPGRGASRLPERVNAMRPQARSFATPTEHSHKGHRGGR